MLQGCKHEPRGRIATQHRGTLQRWERLRHIQGQFGAAAAAAVAVGQSAVSHAPLCVSALHHCFLPCLLAATAAWAFGGCPTLKRTKKVSQS